jgi:hypothetical protein
MLTTILLIVVSAAIGWVLPQPLLAKLFQAWAVELIKKLISKYFAKQQ